MKSCDSLMSGTSASGSVDDSPAATSRTGTACDKYAWTEAYVSQPLIKIDGTTYVHPFPKKANISVVWNFFRFKHGEDRLEGDKRKVYCLKCPIKLKGEKLSFYSDDSKSTTVELLRALMLIISGSERMINCTG